ncbi:hypothetical protein J6590_053139 [Homalodisca vitripennis]|nr:hypothetical protein J6590_053139 [Homalodisca vitripennis]
MKEQILESTKMDLKRGRKWWKLELRTTPAQVNDTVKGDPRVELKVRHRRCEWMDLKMMETRSNSSSSKRRLCDLVGKGRPWGQVESLGVQRTCSWKVVFLGDGKLVVAVAVAVGVITSRIDCPDRVEPNYTYTRVKRGRAVTCAVKRFVSSRLVVDPNIRICVVFLEPLFILLSHHCCGK